MSRGAEKARSRTEDKRGSEGKSANRWQNRKLTEDPGKLSGARLRHGGESASEKRPYGPLTWWTGCWKRGGGT